jgi:putative transposase
MRTIIYNHKFPEEIRTMLQDYRDIVNYLLQYAIDNKINNSYKLRDENKVWFKTNYDYASHYLHSASSQASAMYKSYKKLLKKRKYATGIPEQHRLVAKLDQMIARYKINDDSIIIKITIQPRNIYSFEIPFKHKNIGKYKDSKIGEITITEYKIYLPFQYEEEKTIKNETVGIDLNFNNLTLSYDNGDTEYISLNDIEKVKDNMLKKRQKIQSKLSNNPQKLKKLNNKYNNREKNRIKDRLHKKANEVIEKAGDRNIVFEDLTDIRKQKKSSKNFNRRLNRWIHYRLKEFIIYRSSSEIIEINPRGTSKYCSGCGSEVHNPTWKVSYCDNCKKFMDRDGNASINILNAGYKLLWGVPLPPNVVTSLISSWTLNDVQKKNIGKFI